MQRAADGIHVGGRVLRLALLFEHLRHHIENHVSQAHQFILREALLGKIHLRRKTRVGHAQHCMAVARDHLAAVQRIPGKFVQLLTGWHAAKMILDLDQPAQAFLVGQAMQRAGQPIQRGREGAIGVGERRANQVHGMRRNVARLVV